jgi:hypothetical protein
LPFKRQQFNAQWRQGHCGDPWVLHTVRVENHYATRDEDHVLLGRTATRGTVVRLDKRFVDAELKIATGLVEPHFMEWQTQMQLKPMAVGTLQLYSRLSPSQQALTGICSIGSVCSAVLESVAASGDSAVAIIPEGPYVVPFCRS